MSKNKENEQQFEDDIETDDTDFESADDGSEDLSDEDWESYDDETPEETEDGAAAPVAGKKKSSTFNIALISVAVLGGLGLVVMKMGGGAPAPAPQAATQQATPEELASQAAAEAAANAPPTPIDIIYGHTDQSATKSPDAPESATKKEGLFNDPAAMDALEAVQKRVAKIPGEEEPESATAPDSSPPMPAPMMQAESQPLTPLPTDITAAEPPAPAQAAPVSAGLPKASDIVLNKAAAPVEPVTAAPLEATPDITAAAPSPSLQSGDAQAVMDKLDQIASRIDGLEARLNKADSAASAGQDEAREIKASISALEERLNDAPAKTAETSAPKAAPKEAPAKKAAPAAEKQAVKPAAKPAAPHAASHHAPEKPAAAPQSGGTSASWVLKSAMPGSAMVAKKGSGEVFTVVTGGTLPGIGTIKSIAIQNGKWVVQGSTGRIDQ